jgi:hypothetical protein
MRLSLRSLSFFFCFSSLLLLFSASFAAAFAFCPSLSESFASEWRLLLELDFNNDGKPKLSIDDFFCEVPGVEVDIEMTL